MNKKRIIFIISIVLIILICGIILFLVKKEEQDSYVPDKEIFKNFSKVYKDNDYYIITPQKDGILYNYYEEYLYGLLNDNNSLWDLLSKENKIKMFDNDYKKFESYCKFITSVSTSSNTIEKYKVENKGIKKIYTILDSENHLMKIISSGLWNIEFEMLES